MKIYHRLDDFVRLKYAVVTSGTFDGVHLGHQKILARLIEIAKRHQGESVVLTFWPHPRLVLHPEEDTLKLLNTFEEKAELMKEAGINHLVRIPFTKEFSNYSSEEFIRKVLVDTLGTRKLVIGYDHRFGRNREGSFEQLIANAPRYGFEVEEISRQDVDHIGVSSTRIRNALAAGDIQTATHFLGRPYSITGRVIHGDKLGRILGFPTANIEIDSKFKLIPADGIYAVTADHERQRFKGMMYIGNRPAVAGTRLGLEVNLFDFNRDIYGDDITVHFHDRIREDSMFHDLEDLKRQLFHDKAEALKRLEHINLTK